MFTTSCKASTRGVLKVMGGMLCDDYSKQQPMTVYDEPGRRGHCRLCAACAETWRHRGKTLRSSMEARNAH
jgi:hypothetical protein